MFPYNRRMPINRYVEREPPPSHNTNSDLKNTIDTISNYINEIKNSIHQIENKIHQNENSIHQIENKIDNLENKFDEEGDTKNNTLNANLTDIRSELEVLKNSSPKAMYKTTPSDSNNKAIMQGSGFANITADYLKNMNKR